MTIRVSRRYVVTMSNMITQADAVYGLVSRRRARRGGPPISAIAMCARPGWVAHDKPSIWRFQSRSSQYDRHLTASVRTSTLFGRFGDRFGGATVVETRM